MSGPSTCCLNKPRTVLKRDEVARQTVVAAVAYFKALRKPLEIFGGKGSLRTSSRLTSPRFSFGRRLAGSS
jgi:hypothetical protein